MSNNQTQDWLLSMEEEFYCADRRKKQVKILDTLREHGFGGYADDWERDILCEDCEGEGEDEDGRTCICVKEALQDKEMQEL